jgi:4-amino-4-deoxy-L-arabinose transferase-like glycosyltransferase
MNAARSAPNDQTAYAVTPATGWMYAALITAWLLPGLVGHDPWKPDEADAFGAVYSLLQGGSWVVPMLAGEPFLESPPLYYLSAAAFAKLLGGWLPAHDAARFASAFYILVALVFVKLAARRLLGRAEGWIAILMFIGCMGLLRAHLAIPDSALLAGLAIAYYGFALAGARPIWAGVLIGTGTGIGFLAKGVLAPASILMGALLLPLAFSAWRNRAFALAMATSVVAAAPWLTAWPLLLYRYSPRLFDEWFAGNVLAWIPWHSVSDPLAQTWFVLKTMLWTAWPALPIAAAALWHGRRQALGQAAVQIALTSLAAMFLLLAYMPGIGEVEVLPIVLPITLIAAAGLNTLRRGTAAWLDWFGIMTLGLFALLIWLAWVHMVSGYPDFLSRRSSYFRLGPTLPFQPLAFGFAALVTVGWIALVWRVGRGNRRAVVNWAGGITLVWILAMTLCLPWIDSFKSYRPVVAAVSKHLPAAPGCVASRGLGPAPRAMFHYFGDILTQRLELKPKTGCDFLLVQSEQDPAVGAPWKKIWEGGRPLEKERFRLYRRAGA